MHIHRKEFLKLGSLATASFFVPKFLKAFEAGNLVPPGNKVVVILQLSGGNDGLNTVIPYRNDIYYRSRPALGITRSKLISLNDEVGLHPSLTSFSDAWNDGSLAILNNVGYPNPDRSHFRSMDIWHSASESNEYVNSGWIGRYLDAQCNGCALPTQALEVDDVLSLALKGEQQNGIAFMDPKRLFGTSNEKFFKDISASNKSHSQKNHHHDEDPVDYLYKTMAETISSADHIYKQSRLHPSTTIYPDTEIGKSLKTIASLIFSEINTKVYYLSLGSFDTHIGQQMQQQRLFGQMNAAVESFVKDLKANNRFNDVLFFTFSEFGRRVSQNASGGTDHGTANNMMFLSGGLKEKGLLNALPDLSDLDEGDLKYKVDFKNVYATVLDKWLGADDKKILGKGFDKLKFI